MNPGGLARIQGREKYGELRGRPCEQYQNLLEEYAAPFHATIRGGLRVPVAQSSALIGLNRRARGASSVAHEPRAGKLTHLVV